MVPFKEYRMSTFQVVSLSGIVMGCMLLAFYLGAYFGNKIGFENAMNENLENLAKVPIDLSDTGKDDVDEKTVNQVYEKLKQDSLNGEDDDSLPTLSNILDDDTGSNLDKDKINILDSDKVPSVINNGNKKLVGDYVVEDIEVDDKKDDKKVKNIEKKDEEVKVVLDSINSDEDNLKNEVEKIKQKTDEEFEKSNVEVKELAEDIKKDLKDTKDTIKLAALEANKDEVKKVEPKKEEEKSIEPDKVNIIKEVKEVEQPKKEQIVINNEVKNVELLKPQKVIDENKEQNAQVNNPSINDNRVLPKLPDNKVLGNNNNGDNIPNNAQNNMPSNQNNLGAINQNNNQIGYQGAIGQGQRVVDSLPVNVRANNSNLPRGFYVQIASTPNQSDANILSRKVRESGFKAVIEETIVGGNKYYRVLAGPEDTREHANRMAQQISREPYISSAPFVRDVK